MKGIILAGGFGTRLAPLTNFLNKHMALVYNKPMICYPIDTLIKAKIKDIAVVVSGPFGGQIITFIKDGKQFGLNKLSYLFQESGVGGIADALLLAEDFVNKDDICLILGDNTTDSLIEQEVINFKNRSNKEIPQCHLFLKNVSNPQDYGIARFNEKSQICEIIEKPEFPPSNWAITGLYLYDNNVFNFAKQCKPSNRGQLEITDVNNIYLKNGIVHNSELKGFWSDAGTFDSLQKANQFWFERAKNKL